MITGRRNTYNHFKDLQGMIYGMELALQTYPHDMQNEIDQLIVELNDLVDNWYCKYSSNKSVKSNLNSQTDKKTYPCIKTTNARGVRIIRKGTISKCRNKNYTISANTVVSSGNMELIYLDDLNVINGVLSEDVRIDSNWIYAQDTLDEYAKDGLLYITQDNYIRRIVSDERTKMLKDLLSRVGVDGISDNQFKYDINLNNGGMGTNEDANDELHKLLGQQYVFEFAKPSRLIAKLCQCINDSNAIILDFFLVREHQQTQLCS